jgi:hypothetical protein
MSIRIIFALLILLPLGQTAWAIDRASMEVGGNIYGGQTGRSLAGGYGGFLYFQAQKGKGRIAPYVGAQIEYGFGSSAGVGSFTLYHGNMRLGIDFQPFKTQYVQPFVGFAGIGGWSALAAGSSVTTGLCYGFGASAGAEIRKKIDGRALRISTGYRFLQGKLNDTGAFGLNAVSFTFGIVF